MHILECLESEMAVSKNYQSTFNMKRYYSTAVQVQIDVLKQSVPWTMLHLLIADTSIYNGKMKLFVGWYQFYDKWVFIWSFLKVCMTCWMISCTFRCQPNLHYSQNVSYFYTTLRMFCIYSENNNSAIDTCTHRW